VRSPALLQTLTAKAKRRLADYDCTQLSYEEQLEVVSSAIAVAMDISTSEQAVRQHLKHPEQHVLRNKHADMLTTGTIFRSMRQRWSDYHGSTTNGLPKRL